MLQAYLGIDRSQDNITNCMTTCSDRLIFHCDVYMRHHFAHLKRPARQACSAISSRDSISSYAPVESDQKHKLLLWVYEKWRSVSCTPRPRSARLQAQQYSGILGAEARQLSFSRRYLILRDVYVAEIASSDICSVIKILAGLIPPDTELLAPLYWWERMAVLQASDRVNFMTLKETFPPLERLIN